MNLNRRLGLRAKICLPFALSAAALIFIGILSAITFRDLASNTKDIAENALPAVSEALNGDRDLHQALVAQNSAIDEALLGGDSTDFRAAFDENAKEAFDQLISAVSRLQGTGISGKVEGFDLAYQRWEQAAQDAMDKADKRFNLAAQAIQMGEARTAFGELRDYFEVVGAHADTQAQITAALASEEAQKRSLIILIICAATLSICLAMFVLFLNMIIKSIRQLKDQLDSIAQGEGDLTQRVPVASNDDLGGLAESFNEVLANLHGMIGRTQKLSEDLGLKANELSSAARENNDGMNSQAQLISMVATAINEMQSSIEEIAANAARASDVTLHAHRTTENGERIIRRSSEKVEILTQQISKAVDVIRELAKDSSNITSVLDVIRGVSEQTNLLALNAAIEAARAGEQGRGFAVVADEVRTLAQRTQLSTEDIQSMISSLQTRVSDIVEVMETGSSEAEDAESLASEAEDELHVILESMNHISEVNASVASATEEQTQVVEEINQNILDINQLSSESTQRSNQITEISQSLDDYAHQLRQQTSRFKV